jgi:hypothetical protein
MREGISARTRLSITVSLSAACVPGSGVSVCVGDRLLYAVPLMPIVSCLEAWRAKKGGDARRSLPISSTICRAVEKQLHESEKLDAPNHD